ncbi:MAG: hypothetical protein IIC76_06950 [Bacteroidetes bacterium]|nr:hypothetical protein [Bacteroidota bacterium]
MNKREYDKVKLDLIKGIIEIERISPSLIVIIAALDGKFDVIFYSNLVFQVLKYFSIYPI